MIHGEPIDLRALVREYETQVYCFIFLMVASVELSETLLLQVFREFGDSFRKESRKKNFAYDKNILKIEIFKIAWNQILRSLSQTQYVWALGRDTRPMKMMDSDLLGDLELNENFRPELDAGLLRLSRVDIDFRAPLCLRDILGFEDDEAMRVLQLRWGVYRHRLHRGRLALKDSLRGKSHLAMTERSGTVS